MAHLNLPKDRIHSNCPHKECQRKSAYLDIYHKACLCKGPCERSSLSAFIEDIIDLANTLVQIMIICGIPECKAKRTIDITTYALLNFDEHCYCFSSKKRMRKEDLFCELSKKVQMNRLETHIAYTIIKRAFKATYYLPKTCCTGGMKELEPLTGACIWVDAANRIAFSLAHYKDMTCREQRCFENKFKTILTAYYMRTQRPRLLTTYDTCDCCFCTRNRKQIREKPPPCRKPVPKPICCKKKRKAKTDGKPKTKQPPRCPTCHRFLKFCICPKPGFELFWVKSIWERPDFQKYYLESILGQYQLCKPEELEPFCVDWFNPYWLETKIYGYVPKATDDTNTETP